MININRIDQEFDQIDALLDLIRSAFAYMDGVIDPPSSAHLLTPDTLREKIAQEIVFVATDGDTCLGSIFCRPEATSLYIGKLAVSPLAQGRGLGARLLKKADETARELGLRALRLETRIELVNNHRVFASWGFVKTAENAHAGFDRTTSIEMTKQLG